MRPIVAKKGRRMTMNDRGLNFHQLKRKVKMLLRGLIFRFRLLSNKKIFLLVFLSGKYVRIKNKKKKNVTFISEYFLCYLENRDVYK